MSRKREILNAYADGGICLYETPEINGLRQYVQIRGKSRTAPLMLVLHGGPGGSMAGVCHVMQHEWEQSFTVVNWDQRNTCKTLAANKAAAQASAECGLEDYLADIGGVIAYLHSVYSFEKLILAGFSWGSLIGAEYARRHPEQIACYVGIGQQVHYRDALRASCEKLAELTKNNPADAAKIAAVAAAAENVQEIDAAFLRQTQQFAMLGAKYIAKDAKPFPLKALFSSPFLRFGEKLSMLRADPKLFAGAYRTLLTHDFREHLHFEVPLLFTVGDEDFVTPVGLLQECFDRIEAPEKQLAVIPKASHLCFYDQPETFFRILTEFVGKFT